jgi:hypothetical protein
LKKINLLIGWLTNGLKIWLEKTGEFLEIMQDLQDNQYTCNRYLDYLHYKASEILSLKSEAEDKVRQNRNIEIAENAIKKGFDDQTVADFTDLSIDQIEVIRSNFVNK